MRNLLKVGPVMAIFGAAALATSALAADPHVGPMTQYAQNTVSTWISNPMVIEAIRAQNAAHAGFGQADIDGLDQQWRAETGASVHPMIDRVLGTPCSEFLMDARDGTQGLVTEIFVMDNIGLNVAQSDVTSDYWQGDEAKWQNTFLAGPGALFIDEVELDESTQAFQSQLSMPVVDPATGDVIGAITVGVNVDALL